MLFCDGPLLQNILRGDGDGHAAVKETFLRSRIYDLLREREKILSPQSEYAEVLVSNMKRHSGATTFRDGTDSRVLQLVFDSTD